VTAPSKPFEKFLSHSSTCTAIFTDNEVEAIELLNTSPSIKFLYHYGYKLIFPEHLLCGPAKET
jgi:hypothetical protein